MELKIENLSKTYSNGVQALKNINLSVPTGMFGLLGPNGAGKSTLMRTIATLQNADKGTIFFENINVLNEKDKTRQILGYLPQEIVTFLRRHEDPAPVHRCGSVGRTGAFLHLVLDLERLSGDHLVVIGILLFEERTDTGYRHSG